MGRPKKITPAEIEPEEISQDVPDEDEGEDEDTPPASGKAISGAEAVRRAMSDGLDSPGDIQGFVKSRFGLDIAKTMISSYKSQEKARQAKAGGQSHPLPSMQSATGGIPAGFGGDIKAIKQLIETAGGGEQLKDLAGQIGALVQKYGVAGLNDLIDAFE